MLIDEFKSDCTMLYEITVNDGMGGYESTRIEGATFRAAFDFSTAPEFRVADKSTTSSQYTVTTDKEFILKYHDVFRRESDGKIFRVTSDGDDKFTPQSASLNMRKVTAEEFVFAGGTND